MKVIEWVCILFFAVCGVIEVYWLCAYLVQFAGTTMPDRVEWPAWVQAIGSIGAIGVAVILAGPAERCRELAILRSVGARPRDVFLMLMFVGLVMTVLGYRAYRLSLADGLTPRL
jgi:hypothetical protein